MKSVSVPCIVFLLIAGWFTVLSAEDNTYVGTAACKDCHEKEYQQFVTHAKKADSFANVKKMVSKLTPEEFRSCFECHTTGYGEPGGFVSEAQTPELKNPGCEVCHGPGGRHAQTEDPDLIIGAVSQKSCARCHNSDRIEVFDFTPLLFGGAH